MDAAPEDDLLRRQRAKLSAHAEWLRRQRGRRRPGGSAKHEESEERAESEEREERAESEERGEREREREREGESPGARPRAADESYLVASSGGSVARVQRRSALWLVRRELKLEEQRATRRAAGADGCTFAPRINAPSPSLSPSLSLSPALSARPAGGVDEFVARQRRAREMARARAARGRVDGSKWTSGRTVVEPFALGRRGGAAEAIPSLRPPVPAVAGAVGRALSAGEREREGERGERGEGEGEPEFSLESLATAVGRGLPPPGAFSSWSALQYGGGEDNNADTGST